MTGTAQDELHGASRPRDRVIAVIPAILFAVAFCRGSAQAQTIALGLQTYPDCPVAFINYTPSTFRTEGDRRQFVTVKNQSGLTTAAVVFQQTISDESKTEIVSLERISIIMRPGERKHLSVSVEDVWNRIQAAAKSSDTIGKPALSVVTVEFLDGSLWYAPMGRVP
ncbi:MAG TPA: hypothetical protein VE959_07600 [Bryobacteraceae bacterium]|nr:hypothetical protein [Bryobacteraceae bacterium]